jgi:large subunit ribosomal protein L32
MGALPKRKISKQRKNNRRSHHALNLPALVKDPKTGHLIPPHTVNPYTGEYKGKKVKNID